MKYLLLMLALIAQPALAQETEHKIYEQVMFISDIPLNECRTVLFPPRRLDKMTYPETQLLCNTLGIVYIPKEGTK